MTYHSERQPLLKTVGQRLHSYNGKPPRQLGPGELSSRHRTGILCGLWLATFLSALNSTLVATLVSSISSEFNSAQQASWLGTSFLLATCTFTPLYGRLSNAAGRRTASQIAIASCGVGTIACGFSTSLPLLILARFVAGIGGGGIFTTASICISDLYSMRDRSLAQGYAAIFMGLGLGLGGPVGGFISDRLGWRWAFLFQAPLFVLAFTLVTVNLNYATPGRSGSPIEVLKRIDYFGCATLLCAVGAYLFFLSLKYNEDLPWPNHYVITSLVLAFVFSLAFIFVELFVAVEPMLAPTLLRQRIPVLVGLSNVTLSLVNFSIQYYLPMWFETVQQTSVTIAGLHIMPNSVAMSVGSLFAGYVMHRTGKYKTLNTTMGILPTLSALAIVQLRTDSWAVTKWLGIIPIGFGNAVVLQTTLIALLASIPHSMLAVGTGFTVLFQGIGQVAGVALPSALFQYGLEQQLRIRITGPGSDELIRSIRHSSSVVATLPADIQVLARQAYAASLQRVFVFTALVAFSGWCLRLAIPELSLDKPQEEQDAGETTIAYSAAKPDEELERGLHDIDNDDDEFGYTSGPNLGSLAIPGGGRGRPQLRRLSTFESGDGFDPEIVSSVKTVSSMASRRRI